MPACKFFHGTKLNGKLTTTSIVLWSGVGLIRKDNIRIIDFNYGDISKKVTIPAGDRPIYTVRSIGFVSGQTAVISLSPEGVLGFSTAAGMLSSGAIGGQMIYKAGSP